MTDAPVTIVFTDVEGSTALHTARGDREARAVLSAHEELIRQRVHAAGGREVKSLGDGLMVTFASPLAAVACALAIQDSVMDHGRRNLQGRLRVRVGIHTGMATEEAGDLYGAAVNAAARIASRAQGGEVLVSEVVRHLCLGTPEVVFEDRGHLKLRGFPERWRLFLAVRAVVRPAGVPLGQPTPFIGREVEAAQLRTLIDRAVAGQGALVMIGGEPGVGKTRLAQEIAAECQPRLRVFAGHCYEEEGDLAYMPWVEMIERLAAEVPPEGLRQALGEEAPELARLVPQLRRLLPDLPPPLELPPEQQRRYTFTCLGQYVTRASRDHPRLYLLEDLHWADASTLLLLEYLAERLPTIPCLIIGTYRDPPADVSPRLAKTLSALVRQRLARLMSLRRHSASEVATMVGVLSGQTPPAIVTTAIYAETEGNAFFVEEVFRHLVEGERLLDEQGRFRPDVRVDEVDVPANVRLVIGRRLDRLTESTRRVLTLGAVIGRHFDLALLEAVSGLDEDELIEGLDEAERARLVNSEAVGTRERYRFAHELIRQTLLTRLSATRRRRHHLRVADALERVHAADIEHHAGDVAHHLWQAGGAADGLRTARYLTMAGERSLTAAAFEEALRDFGNALGILPAPQARERAGLLLRVARAQRSLGRWDEALATSETALLVLEALGDVEAVGALCWDNGVHLNWSFRSGEALAVANHGLKVIGDRSAPARARVLAIRALAHSTGCDHVAATADLQEAGRLAGNAGDGRLLSSVLFIEAVHHYMFMTLPLAVDPCRRATQGLRDLGAGYSLAEALAYLDLAYVFLGRFRESNEVQQELEALVERVGHRGAAWSGRRNRFASVAAQTADLAALERLCDAQSGAAREASIRGWTAYAHILRGVLGVWRGDWTAARESLEEGVRLTEPGLWWFGANHGFLIMFHALAGDRDAACALLDEVSSGLPTLGTANTVGSWCLASLAAEGAALLRDADRARWLYPLVVAALGTGTLMRFYDGALLQRCAAMAAAAAGLSDAAEGHFEEALRQAAELPHRLEQPQVQHFYASFLIARARNRDLERARTLLGEAVAGYGVIGMPRHRRMAEQLLVEPGAGGGGGAIPRPGP